MIDVLKYKTVIDDVIKNMRVPGNLRPDMEQECYLALLEKQENLEADPSCASAICRSAVAAVNRVRRKDNKTESLDEPRHGNREASNFLGMIVTDEQLQEAIMTLPYADYQVVWSLYFDGNTERTTAAELNITRRAVRTRRALAVLELRKYFEENV